MKFKLNNIFRSNDNSNPELASTISDPNEEPSNLVRNSNCKCPDPSCNGNCKCTNPLCVGANCNCVNGICTCVNCGSTECVCDVCGLPCECECPECPECPDCCDLPLEDCVYEDPTEIPFTAMIKIACGYVLPDNTNTLNYDFSLDEHCVHCLTECGKQDSYVCIDGEPKLKCEIPVKIGTLVGALHYNVKVTDFEIVKDIATGSVDPTEFSQSESICIKDRIGYACQTCCPEEEECDLCKYEFEYEILEILVIPPGGDAISYTNTPAAAIIALQFTDECKYIQFKGKIIINKG